MRQLLVCVIIVGCIAMAVPVDGAIITPDNIVFPGGTGETFSFDYVIHNAQSTSALAFQATIDVFGPGGLTFDGAAQLLNDGDIMARYAFTWDGTEGLYIFTLDFNTNNSSILNSNFITEALEFEPESDPLGSFSVYLPEPITVNLFVLGILGILRRRKA